MPTIIASTTSAEDTQDRARSQQPFGTDMVKRQAFKRKAKRGKPKSYYGMNQLKSDISSTISSLWSWATGSITPGDEHQVTVQSALANYLLETALSAIKEAEERPDCAGSPWKRKHTHDVDALKSEREVYLKEVALFDQDAPLSEQSQCLIKRARSFLTDSDYCLTSERLSFPLPPCTRGHARLIDPSTEEFRSAVKKELDHFSFKPSDFLDFIRSLPDSQKQGVLYYTDILSRQDLEKLGSGQGIISTLGPVGKTIGRTASLITWPGRKALSAAGSVARSLGSTGGIVGLSAAAASYLWLGRDVFGERQMLENVIYGRPLLSGPLDAGSLDTAYSASSHPRHLDPYYYHA